MRLPALILIICVLSVLAGCSGRRPEPNVLLLVLYAARADHFSCYGYERPTSPISTAWPPVACVSRGLSRPRAGPSRPTAVCSPD